MPFKVPIDHVSESIGPGMLVHGNFFFIALVPSLLCFAHVLKKQARTSATVVTALSIAVSVALASTVCLEHYYYAECPVESVRMLETGNILKKEAEFHRTQPDVWQRAYPYVVCDGVALCIVRGYDHLIPWDQDTDILMKYDLVADPEAEDLAKRLKAFFGPDYLITYSSERHLMQVDHPATNAHGDIWLWTEKMVGGTKMLWTPDPGYGKLPVANCLPHDLIVPPRTVPWKLNGEVMQIAVANNLHEYLLQVFGPHYMEPYRSRMQCTENLGKHASKGWMLSYALIAAVFSYYVSKTANAMVAAKPVANRFQ